MGATFLCRFETHASVGLSRHDASQDSADAVECRVRRIVNKGIVTSQKSA